MIITRTPFRVSFVGGGTDLEAFCNVEPGAVISATIDKYIYVTVKRQVAIASHKFRVSWNRLEFCNSIDQIEHPIVREALKLLNIDFPLEVTTFADIPSQTGLGSSSAFAVGLLNALHALLGRRLTKHELAAQAAELEIRTLGRKIGAQDHYAASYGSINVFRFLPELKVERQAVLYKKNILRQLEQSLLMFYTESQRDAGVILANQSEMLEKSAEEAEEKFQALRTMRDLVEPFEKIFSNNERLDKVGELLHQNWLLKRQLSKKISNPEIDELYERARIAGAIGGKILGAGGGGFLLLYVPEEKRLAVREALRGIFCMPIHFEHNGSVVTYYDHSGIEEDAHIQPVMIDYSNQNKPDSHLK
jgi:D-glycero-alpha-D-manno-heptose-7-phosphate kinase